MYLQNKLQKGMIVLLLVSFFFSFVLLSHAGCVCVRLRSSILVSFEQLAATAPGSARLLFDTHTRHRQHDNYSNGTTRYEQ